MSLLITYVITLLIAQSISISLGLLGDMHSPHTGLMVFLAMYFSMFIVSWKIAVRITAPRATDVAAPNT